MHHRVKISAFVVVCILACIIVLQQREYFNTMMSVCNAVKEGRYRQVSLANVIDTGTCAEMIRAAETHATKVGGWSTKRHENHPTTDFDTADVPALKFPVKNLVYRHIIPRLARAFDLDPMQLGISEVFIAKYSASDGAQRSLEEHTDGSDFSFVVTLNEGFEGGGTKFGDTVRRLGVGSVVGFCGQTKHEGLAVTAGTRYILAGFLQYGGEGCL